MEDILKDITDTLGKKIDSLEDGNFEVEVEMGSFDTIATGEITRQYHITQATQDRLNPQWIDLRSKLVFIYDVLISKAESKFNLTSNECFQIGKELSIL